MAKTTEGASSTSLPRSTELLAARTAARALRGKAPAAATAYSRLSLPHFGISDKTVPPHSSMGSPTGFDPFEHLFSFSTRKYVSLQDLTQKLTDHIESLD